MVIKYFLKYYSKILRYGHSVKNKCLLHIREMQDLFTLNCANQLQNVTDIKITVEYCKNSKNNITLDKFLYVNYIKKKNHANLMLNIQ